ncbi:hypothetical protein ACH5RR_036392 [Cinchona calisaya]|uniref:Uncharacterized protein n=1 Tax=Cinchona calisaya TaxID=153742 RepID=A0ABD2Y362_9GENT
MHSNVHSAKNNSLATQKKGANIDNYSGRQSEDVLVLDEDSSDVEGSDGHTVTIDGAVSGGCANFQNSSTLPTSKERFPLYQLPCTQVVDIMITRDFDGAYDKELSLTVDRLQVSLSHFVEDESS